MSEADSTLNMREQLARINRAIAGHGKFHAETEKLFAAGVGLSKVLGG